MTIIEYIDDISKIYDGETLELYNVSFKLDVFNEFLSLIEQKEIIIKNLIINYAEIIKHKNFDLTNIVSKIIKVVGIFDSISIRCLICFNIRQCIPTYDNEPQYVEYEKLNLRRLCKIVQPKFVKYLQYNQSFMNPDCIRYFTKMAIQNIYICAENGSKYILHELKTALAVPSSLSKRIKIHPHVCVKLQFRWNSWLAKQCQKQIIKYNKFHVIRTLLNNSLKSHKANPLLPFPVDGGHIELFKIICEYAVYPIREYNYESNW
jgi:hypothetical protein